jgi:hypothetical protein
MDELTRQLLNEAFALSDAANKFCYRRGEFDDVLQRSSGDNLIFKINENTKVESSPQPEPASGLSEEEMDGIGIALGTIRKQMRDHADAIERRLRAEQVALEGRQAALEDQAALEARQHVELRDEVKALRAQIESKTVTPLRGRDVA